MRYASIDIETTGLDHNTCQILEFGCVLDDTDPEKMVEMKNCPQFRALILHNQIIGEPYALALNAKLIAEIRDAKGEFKREASGSNLSMTTLPQYLASNFLGWLESNGYEVEKQESGLYGLKSGLICAGKNFASFDKRFLERLDSWNLLIRMKHRVIDPAMFYMHPTDPEPPKTEVCYERAGILEVPAHTAVEDAVKVCLLVRHAMRFYGAT